MMSVCLSTCVRWGGGGARRAEGERGRGRERLKGRPIGVFSEDSARIRRCFGEDLAIARVCAASPSVCGVGCVKEGARGTIDRQGRKP